MDSVTQFALGATVGAAVLGKHVGVRRAAITGGLLGTLPDLDVYIPVDDPVEAFVGHRGATHSLIVHALITPLIGEALVRSFAKLRPIRPLAYAAVFLCLTTHALLDAMTIYGTRLFWPIWDEPLGLGSIFIIDPLYSLPLLVMTIWAVFRREWTERYGKAVKTALVFSTLYLGWTAVGQQIAEARGISYLEERGLPKDQILAGPTPLNSLFWRLISVDGSTYYHVYVPLLAGVDSITAYRHQRWGTDIQCWAEREVAGSGVAATLADFADGFYEIVRRNGDVVVSDLRMGSYPQFVFRFAVASYADGIISDKPPVRLPTVRRWPGDMDWLVAGVTGARMIRLQEEARLVADPRTQISRTEAAVPNAC